MNNQKGFTLIELVMVIVILGIMSAVAVPKFMDIHGDAYEAKIKAARGAFKAAISIVHAKSLVKGVGTGTAAEWLDINDNGTTAWADGDVRASNSWPYATSNAQCVSVFNNLIDDDIKAAANDTEDFKAEHRPGNVCRYTDSKSGETWQFDYDMDDGSVTQLQ